MSYYQLDHVRTTRPAAIRILNAIIEQGEDYYLEPDVFTCFENDDGSITLDWETWQGSPAWMFEDYLFDGEPWLMYCIDNDFTGFDSDDGSEAAARWREDVIFRLDKDGCVIEFSYPGPYTSRKIDYKDLLVVE